MDPSDIVERLSDLARFYLNERPTVNPQERSPTLVEMGEPEAQEIASELYKAINEIQSLRAALADERERCAKVAETHFDLRHSTLARIHGHSIAAAIRARGR